MRGRGVLAFVLLGVALLLGVDSATATPGALDPGFGSSGTVTTTLGSGGSQANALVVQPDGKILAGGETSVGSQQVFALARYNLDGTLDSSFGTAGEVTTAIGSEDDAITALALQPDGKIVAAGWAYDGSSYAFALARYNPDGSLDPSFGTGGTVITPIPPGLGGEANAIVLQPDGKLVVGGVALGRSPSDFVVARYGSNGSLDTSFGTGGIAMTATDGGVNALALQPDGKIVAAGGCCPVNSVTLARYNPDGTLDTSFGHAGVVTIDAPYPGSADGLVLQPDGKIVVGGQLADRFGLLRFDSDGTLDPSFGDDGRVITSIGTFASGRALVQQPNGELVLAGYDTAHIGSGPGTVQQFALARYNPDGSLDQGFGVGGVVTTTVDANGSAAEAAALEPDGKIVVGGFTEGGGNTASDQFALARYLVTSTLRVSASGDGSGVVTSSPSGIDCGTTCTASFPTGPVTLTETPEVGSIFTGWTGGDCSGTGSCQVQMSSDQSVTATFSLIAETLAVTTSGHGSGTVTSRPGGISCGHTCSHPYSYGTTVTLKPRPARSSTFEGWSGACSGTGACSVKMNQAQSTTATFGLEPCIVPRVEGKSLQSARHRITRAHCRVGRIRRRYSAVQKDRVISQKPAAGRHRRHGAKVVLVISKGARL